MKIDIRFFPEPAPHLHPQSHPQSPFFSREFLQNTLNSFKATIADPRHGFFNIAVDQTEGATEAQKLYQKFRSRQTFVHVGIGGSSLGPEMLIHALGKERGRSFTFIDNVDPETLAQQLQDLVPEKALFYFVSKSGKTVETLAALAIITRWLKEKGIKEDRFKDFLIFATDYSSSGDLLEVARQFSIDCLSIPSNIGGRFSVLTPVGLLPAFFANIDVWELLKGARDVRDGLLEEDNPLLKTASFIMSLFMEEGIGQTVFMPYSSKLKKLSSWMGQLWAESLGKKGKGLTPIPACGTTDQHSQMQLFMEGPRNKCVFFFQIGTFLRDFSLKGDFGHATTATTLTTLQKLAPYTLGQLLTAEFQGTCSAMRANNRPFIHLHLPQNDEYHMGALILFLESLTVLLGGHLDVNPFDQPGVEAGKRLALEHLQKL